MVLPLATLPYELIDWILCHGGPIRCAHDRRHVAAVRLQRLWRRCRLRDGLRILYRYRWMRLWREGTVHSDGHDSFVIRADRRVIFNVKRTRLQIIVVSEPHGGSR